jgi:hypothetical protein
MVQLNEMECSDIELYPSIAVSHELSRDQI